MREYMSGVRVHDVMVTNGLTKKGKCESGNYIEKPNGE